MKLKKGIPVGNKGGIPFYLFYFTLAGIVTDITLLFA